MDKKILFFMVFFLMVGLGCVWGQAESVGLPSSTNVNSLVAEKTPLPFSFKFDVEHTEDPKKIAKGIQIVLFLTALGLAPTFFVLVTSFTRISVILSFLKKAAGLGTQPSNQIMSGLALFLTIYVMAPVWMEINDKALKPYMTGELTQGEAFGAMVKPLRTFMFKYTREKDIALFMNIAKKEQPRSKDDIPTYLLIPAYVISELKTAFQIGFLLFLPFLVIDMTVASVLLSMGMIVLPPITVSTPFKILLFVMVDGWYLIIKSITLGFY